MSYYQNLLKSLHIGFCIVEVLFDQNKKAVDYRFLEMNDAFEQQTGLINAQGKTILEIVPKHEEHWIETYGKVALTGEPVEFENIAAQLGRYYHVYAYRFGNPEECKVAILFNDIREKKEALENLKRTEARYRTTLDSMMEGCAIVSFDWTYLYVNETNAMHSHLKREEMIGRKMIDLFPGIENSSFYLAFKDCMNERKPQQVEDRFVFPDGSEGWYQSVAQPVPEGIFILSNDITNRKEADLKLKNTLQNLKISEEKLKNALKIAKMGQVEIDIITGDIFWSDEVFKIFERPVKAGQPSFEEAFANIYDNDRERVLTVLQNPLQGKLVEVDCRIYLPEGRIKHLAYILTPIIENGRQMKSVGTIQDITDRKLIEKELQQKIEEREVLLKELYHRIKNNMQVISSLLTLRADSILNEEDREIFLKMKNHVQAMSLVHEKLYQSNNLSRINLGSYIKDLSHSLWNAYDVYNRNIQIFYNLENIEVLMDIALPIGFAITELIHNIIKYAFPGNKDGIVNIILFKSNDETINFRISDDGVGIPHSKLNDNNQLGLMLVRTLIEDQLSGKISLESSNGTCWEFIIKNDLYNERV